MPFHGKHFQRPVVFPTFSEKYLVMIFHPASLYLKNESDARDGLQDIFLKMWEKQPVFENASHEKAWLISTTKHYCLDVLKSSWHKKRVALDINREIMSDEREQEYPVLDEILKLPQKYREVLYFYIITVHAGWFTRFITDTIFDFFLIFCYFHAIQSHRICIIVYLLDIFELSAEITNIYGSIWVFILISFSHFGIRKCSCKFIFIL